MSDNKKQTKRKILSSADKLLLKQLGCIHLIPAYMKKEDNMKESLDEIKASPPSYVCAKVKVKPWVRFDMGGRKLTLKYKEEVMVPLSFFMGNHKDKKGRIILEPGSRTFMNRFRRYDGQDLTNKNLFIWRFGGIGDIMFCQPLVKHLKKKYPTCKILFATAPQNMGVFDFWPKGLIDQVVRIPFKSKYMDVCDYHITFEGSIERCKEAHELNCYDIFAKMAGVEFNPADYPLEAYPDQAIVDEVGSVIPPRTIAIQSRASSPLRVFPLPKVIELINSLSELGFYVGLIDASKEADKIESWLKSQRVNIKHPEKVLNLAKLSKSLTHCVAILKSCEGSISTDSSVTHLSAAVGIPAIGMYGPFRGELRMKYYPMADWVNGSAEWNECGRAPCYAHDAQMHLCPYMKAGKFAGCLDCIKIEDVVEKFVNVYEQFEDKKNNDNK